jgi:hypothetical protein
MLAYVFWHWKQTKVTATEYEERQRRFHAALAAAPATGFIDSFSVGITHVPWVPNPGEVYEDWYWVEDFTALGLLNEAAISGARSLPHDEAAAMAGGGTAGVYGLKHGTAMRQPQYAHWFAKPEGMPYPDLLSQLAPLVDQLKGALWMRQMTLGPAREFCLHTPARASLPTLLSALGLPLRSIWPKA